MLKAIFDEVLKEMKHNKDFKLRITGVVEKIGKTPPKGKKRSQRRKPGPFDPVEVYQIQPETLKPRLEDLDIEQLKDIIAEHGMDRSRLAMRWKTKKRLVDLILLSVKNRVLKGDAFRGPKIDGGPLTLTEKQDKPETDSGNNTEQK